MGLREIIKKSDPSKTSFSDDPEVRNHADKLYQAVVNSIRDMVWLTTKKKGGFEGAWRQCCHPFMRPSEFCG